MTRRAANTNADGKTTGPGKSTRPDAPSTRVAPGTADSARRRRSESPGETSATAQRPQPEPGQPAHTDDEGTEQHRFGTQSVRRAIAVLRLVACGQDAGMKLSEVAALSGLSRPTAHRLLGVLVDEGVVEQDATTRRYVIGRETTLLGLARTTGVALRQVAEPYLHALAQQAGDTVFLTVRQGADSVCIGRVLGHHPIQVLSIDVGVRRPLGASVSGIVLWSGLDDAQAARWVHRNTARLAHDQRDADVVLARVQRARQDGYTYAPDGVMPGTSAVAVPVTDEKGEITAAISIAALADRLDARRLPTVLDTMRQQAAMVTRRLEELAQARKGRGSR